MLTGSMRDAVPHVPARRVGGPLCAGVKTGRAGTGIARASKRWAKKRGTCTRSTLTMHVPVPVGRLLPVERQQCTRVGAMGARVSLDIIHAQRQRGIEQ